LRNAASSTGALGGAAAGAAGGSVLGGGLAGAAEAGAGGAAAVAAAALDGAAGGAGLAGACAGAAASAACSSVRIRWPSLTLSPTLTPTDLTVPAAGAGTSIVALSDSSVTSESSALTASPGLTRTSMTGTSVKSPMSGTLTSIVLIATSKACRQRRTTPFAASDRPRRGLRRVDAVFCDRLGHFARGQRAVIGQRLQRRDGDVRPVDFEKAAQLFARVRASEAVGAEHHVTARHEFPDLPGERAHIVGRCDDGTL